MALLPPPRLRPARQPVAGDIGRGVARLLRAHALAPFSEVALANGRRADVIGLSRQGKIWIVEIKSSLEDYRADRKWSEYRGFCDEFYFAVGPSFPSAVLPVDTGLIIADRWGGEILRRAPQGTLAAARRRRITLEVARTAGLRLSAML